MNIDAKIDKKRLEQFLKATDVCGDEIALDVHSDGIHSRNVDAAHVMMTTAYFTPEVFEHYDVDIDDEDEWLLQFDIDAVKNKLKVLPSPVHLACDNDGALVLSSDGHRFTASLLDEVMTRANKVPSLEQPFKVDISLDELKRIVRGAQAIRSNVFFVTVSDADGAVKMGAHGGGRDDYVWQGDIDEYAEVKTSFNGVRTTNVSIDYISDAVDALAGDMVTLAFDEGMPLSMQSCVGGDIQINALIAPRIRNE